MRLVISLIFLAAAIMSFFTWTKPIFDEIKVLKVEEKKLNDALSSTKELQTIRDKFLNQFNSISTADIERLNKALPDRINAMALILEIENMAKKNGLLLKDINVDPLIEKKKSLTDIQIVNDAESLRFSFKLVGPYESFISFVGDLEKSVRIIEVEQISFNSSETNSYEYNIKALTFWDKQI